MNPKPYFWSYRKDMNRANKYICLVLFLLAGPFLYAQSTSEKLKKEQEKLEKKISDTRSLLGKSEEQTQSSLNDLRVIENQIRYREELLRNYDNQIRGAELKISEKEKQVEELRLKLEKLKAQYKELVIYAYKHRNKYGNMMYIFSAETYYEALKRKKYLEKVAEIQKKQFLIIKQHQELIREEIAEIEKEKHYKTALLGEKKREKEVIQKDREKQQVLYEQYKQEEAQLRAQLQADERKKEVLKQQITAAIQKEIAAAEAERKRREAEARKKREAENAKAGNTAKAPEVKEEVSFAETKESAALSRNFEGNRGKLPWPVEKGTITEGYGRNAHPTLQNVYTNNNGVDIGAPKNSQVRAVFEGEVTSILNIPGAGKVVIIKHGNYRTVYGNLQDVYVTVGMKVKTKQAIGSLLSPVSGAISTAHFEIHQVNGTAVQSLNPALWIAN